MSNKALFVTWEPKTALDGMQQLSPWEELAYRRIIDLIYTTGNSLRDDDTKLGWMTKTGRRWPKIKAALLVDDKIYIQDGLIRNKKCDACLRQNEQTIERQSRAGLASAAARKALKDKDTSATAVPTDVPTATPTADQPNHLTTKPLNQRKKNTKKKTPSLEEEFEIWYSAYPTHVGRGQALRAYRTARTKASAEVLLAGVQKYRENKPSYAAWAQPATWLNGERWLDDPDPDAPKAQEFPSDWKPKIVISEGVSGRDAAAWTAVMEDLAAKIGPGEFESWLGKLMLSSVAGDDLAKTFHATAPTAFIRDTAQQRYTETLGDMLAEKAGAAAWREILIKKMGGGSQKTNKGTTQADLAGASQ